MSAASPPFVTPCLDAYLTPSRPRVAGPAARPRGRPRGRPRRRPRQRLAKAARRSTSQSRQPSCPRSRPATSKARHARLVVDLEVRERGQSYDRRIAIRGRLRHSARLGVRRFRCNESHAAKQTTRARRTVRTDREQREPKCSGFDKRWPSTNVSTPSMMWSHGAPRAYARPLDLDAMTDALKYAQDHADRFVEELKAWLRIPSISTDPTYAAQTRRAADWLVDNLRDAGLEDVEVMETAGHPSCSPRTTSPTTPRRCWSTATTTSSRRTRSSLWDNDPFEPVEVDGNLVARGAADDKGQAFMHVKAAEALLSTSSLPVNLKIMVEGEEEIGSVHLPDFLRENQDRLKADIVVVSDTALFAPGVPSIAYGLRGLAYVEVELTGTVQGPALRHLRRRHREPDQRARPDDRRPARRRPPRHHRGLLRQRPRPRGRRARGVPRAAVRPRGLEGGGRRRRDQDRGRLLRPRGHLRSADVGRERHLGRLHRRGRQDGAALQGDGQDLVPLGAGPDAGRDHGQAASALRKTRPGHHDARRSATCTAGTA